MGKGLTITRYFTKEGISVKELFQWTQRDVQLLNDKGAVLFSDTVEAPDFWSDTAVQIAASKYFCIDSKGIRENSIWQMICRVVDKITEFANEQNYFINAESSVCFSDELKYIFVNQMAAMNSPVWFNFGAHGHLPMSSACYILGVEDSIDSIMQSATDESMIFKHGSGVGMNLSKLRASSESLSSSGRASGPTSFMHGYDAWAGIIKSGGVTRRAAIMIELDADHPDIKEFITSKATEEYKAHLLLEIAGIAQLVSGVDTQLLENIIARSVVNNSTSVGTLSILEKLKNNNLVSTYLHDFIKQNNWSGFNDNAAYSTVSLQNMNISVSIPDSFMRKVTGKDIDPTWYLFGRKSVELPKAVKHISKKEVAQGVLYIYDTSKYICISKNDYRIVYSQENASDLLLAISESVQNCGDPGVQFIDRINDWFTAKTSGIIRGSNPCSEVFLPDDTSCNLASLRLTKFLAKNGRFDIVSFSNVIRTVFIAQDAIIALSSYPTEAIKNNTIKYRAIGMGAADVGTLLMQSGLAYDSEDGRNYIAAIMSLLTATGYLVSSEIAELVGESDIFENNKEPVYSVLEKHYTETVKLTAKITSKTTILEIAKEAERVWKHMCILKPSIRNMATSCFAPTGTVGLLMDCQTTGIEPEFSLIKYKRLVGGGTMQFVNDSVNEALRILGYSPEDREMIEQYVKVNGHLENSCILKNEDLSVFDCAGKVNGSTRIISPTGHIDMMSAVQPFISMGISKTINTDEHSTVNDIYSAFIYSWERGLKAVAIYRDKSKRIQPLTSKLGSDSGTEFDIEFWKARAEELGIQSERKKMSDNCPTIRHKFSIGGHEGYLHCGMYDNGKLGEIFVRISKEGSTISGVIDAFATMFSIALQRGTPLDTLVQKFAFQRFEPSGWTKCRNIPKAESVVDYIVRWLAFQFLSREEAESIGVQFFDDADETRDKVIGRMFGKIEQKVQLPDPEILAECAEYKPIKSLALESDAPTCNSCGSRMQRAGKCFTCHSCGSSSGCS